MALSNGYCPSTVRWTSLSYSFLSRPIRRGLSSLVVGSSLSMGSVAGDELSFVTAELSLSTTGFPDTGQ